VYERAEPRSASSPASVRCDGCATPASDRPRHVGGGRLLLADGVAEEVGGLLTEQPKPPPRICSSSKSLQFLRRAVLRGELSAELANGALDDPSGRDPDVSRKGDSAPPAGKWRGRSLYRRNPCPRKR